MITIVIVLLLIALLAIIFILFNSQTTEESSKRSVSNESNKNEPLIIGDKFRILSAQELIDCLKLEPVLKNIQINLGFSNEAWAKDALPFVHTYIEFVQRLPASENHHHAGDGGLIRHTLDVAIYALNASKAKSWPPGAKTETIAKLTAVWRYGIFVGAILHDVGKTLTGFEVYLYSDPKEGQKQRWFPDSSSMQETGAKYYQLVFPDHKTDYKVHSQIAWMFFQRLVPASTRAWLTNMDPELMLALRTYLSAQNKEEMTEIAFAQLITEADKASTKRDLKEGSRQRFSAAKRKPLIEILMGALREILKEPSRYGLSIGKNGGGSLFIQGEYIYFVCRPMVEAIREYLKETSPATKLPQDNERIFDTFLESAAVQPSPYDPDKAITQITIEMTKNSGTKQAVSFTTLCFEAKNLYPDGDVPEQYKGQMLVHQQYIKTDDATDNNNEHGASVKQENEPEAAVAKNDLVESVEYKKHIDGAQEVIAKKNDSKEPKKDIKVSKQNKKNASIDDILLACLDSDEENNEDVPEAQVKNMEQSIAIAPKKEANLTIKASSSVGSLKNLKAKLAQINHVSETQPERQEEAAQEDQESKVTIEPDEPLSVQALFESQNNITEDIGSPSPVHVASNEAVNDLDLLAQQVQVNHTYHMTTENTESDEQPLQEQIKSNLMNHGNNFLQYLADGLANKTLTYNDASSAIHFIPEGMLLVTPKIFKEFVGGVFDKNDRNSPGPLAQRGFESLGIHKNHKSARGRGTTAHWKVISANDDSQHAKQVFHAYLIPEENLFRIIQPSSRPANNPLIKLFVLNLLS
ncbi:MobH family relaxase [Neisseria sp. Ec49-e6-T10]|uniref:MobH family relaxase n=1 Tax=Neisseria sp. Ec49-e6-T10 TaxID=3140744 RepID=UPI003EBED285